MDFQSKKLINDPNGGGSGHEPAHAGFVGEGMLTAAICGDVFASPPVDSILAGIRAVTGPSGCLLIVKHGEPGAAVADLQPVDIVVSHVLKQILSTTLGRPQQLSPEGHILEIAIEAAAKTVIDLKDILNELDGKVGDGDCGSTMSKGASAILEDMKKCYPLNDPAEAVNEIGTSIRKVMGGTSGIIYDIFCKAAYAQLKASSQSGITALEWAGALEAAIDAVSKYGGAKAGYRTLLDALIPASSVLKEKLAAGEDPVQAFALSAEAAVSGAESTKNMQAQAGRSSYVSADILASVPDPGAVAAASWYKAAASAVKNKYQAL
ncbi:UNVERIFIED_CONTAM: putative 3,4-dihydroxy-2-butanone kinase [Sesamum radiatum]|uniref:3,4-dihydroxy-2-butanone kinase n=1 Tax=Sesamum radiatum TaxID=300843 RepID=A0AAW2V8E1_SESRA